MCSFEQNEPEMHHLNPPWRLHETIQYENTHKFCKIPFLHATSSQPVIHFFREAVRLWGWRGTYQGFILHVVIRYFKKLRVHSHWPQPHYLLSERWVSNSFFIFLTHSACAAYIQQVKYSSNSIVQVHTRTHYQYTLFGWSQALLHVQALEYYDCMYSIK